MKNSISALLPFGGFCLQWPPVNMAIATWQHFSRPTRKDPWSHHCKSLNFTLAQHTCIEWLLLLSFVLGLLYEDPSLIVNIVQPVFSTHLCKLENNKVGTLKLFEIRAIRVIFIDKVSLCVYNTCPYLLFFSFDFSPSSSLTFVVLRNTKNITANVKNPSLFDNSLNTFCCVMFSMTFSKLRLPVILMCIPSTISFLVIDL